MEYYTWILTFHVMSFMSWMAMLFYQPRLYVYHSEHRNSKAFTDVVEVQERKMYKLIGVPAMWATIISGGVMLWLNPYLLETDWMIAKLIVLVLLVAYSFSMNYYMERLKAGQYNSGNFFRAYNEVPTFLSLLIVGYVVVKVFSWWFTIITLAFAAFVIYKVYKQTPKGA
jgi:putative membrane protein